jgi:hypothetical protein
MAVLMKTGSVAIDHEIDPTLLPAHLAECLRGVDASAVEVSGNRVTFKGGVFRFVTNWNVLVPFGFGDLTVDSQSGEVRYRLSCRQLFIFLIVMTVVLTATLLVLAGGSQEMSRSMLTLPLIFIGLIFLNLAIRTWDFRRFLRRSIVTAPRLIK